MTNREMAFRSTPKSSAKYFAAALSYIKELNTAGKVIEARYHLEHLAAVKPKNAQVIRLGYELAVKSFDTAAMRRYDLALFDSKPKRGELLYYRLMLYFANGNTPLCLECAREMLKYKMDEQAMYLIVDVILTHRCARLTMEFETFLASKKLKSQGLATQAMKSILIERLLEIIARKSYA